MSSCGGGIKISKSLENQMTEMFENMARQIYMYKGKPVGNKALPHEE